MLSALAFLTSGPWELIIIALIVLLLFGNRLPSMMRSVGRSVVEFKKGVREIEDGSEDEKSEKGSEKVSEKDSE